MSLEPLLDIVMHHGMIEPWPDVNQNAFDALFGSTGGRYHVDARKTVKLRANRIDADSVPFAAVTEPMADDRGGYGGMSIAIFPVPDAPSLITFVVGTHGIAPDDSILGRPGHARKVQAVCAWLNTAHGAGKRIAWAKQNPSELDQSVPAEVTKDCPEYGDIFKRYGNVLYAVFSSNDKAAAGAALTAFLDLMMDERGWDVLTKHQDHAEAIRSAWGRHLLPDIVVEEVHALLRSRRFVVIQGPPGTGKTRMADELVASQYGGNGKSIQFHPNTTYENFVGGLAPVTASASGVGFAFAPLPGFLMEAATKAAEKPSERYLLHIDEINRADLSKVLGEAIYLFEVNPERQRVIDLPYEFPRHGSRFALPDNLDVIGTMNTADRSLAILDAAVRRRFAFVDLWPQLSVVQKFGGLVMQQAFQKLSLIFTEHATDEFFNLMPGHAYFLYKDDAIGIRHLKVTLAPLLREYLAQGYVAGFAEPIRSYLQWLDGL